MWKILRGFHWAAPAIVLTAAAGLFQETLPWIRRRGRAARCIFRLPEEARRARMETIDRTTATRAASPEPIKMSLKARELLKTPGPACASRGSPSHLALLRPARHHTAGRRARGGIQPHDG